MKRLFDSSKLLVIIIWHIKWNHSDYFSRLTIIIRSGIHEMIPKMRKRETNLVENLHSSLEFRSWTVSDRTHCSVKAFELLVSRILCIPLTTQLLIKAKHTLSIENFLFTKFKKNMSTIMNRWEREWNTLVSVSPSARGVHTCAAWAPTQTWGVRFRRRCRHCP